MTRYDSATAKMDSMVANEIMLLFGHCILCFWSIGEGKLKFHV